MTLRGHLLICVAVSFACSLVGCGQAQAPESFEWHVEDTHRWRHLPEPTGQGGGFTRLDSSRTAVRFVNRLSEEAYTQNRHRVNGSGVALGDVNGNGRPDLYLARQEGPNALYYNRGNFRFEKAGDAGGAPMADEFSTGVVLTDLTGNRMADLVVTTLGGPNVMYKNDGNGQFRKSQVLNEGEGSKTVAVGDLSGNGALDLYVANYKTKTVLDVMPPEERRFDDVVIQEDGEYQIRDEYKEFYDVERQVTRVHRYEPAEVDRVYFNDGSGQLVEQEWREIFRGPSGNRLEETPRDWGLVARLEDINGDGELDLYVCNDFSSPDYYYLGRSDTSMFWQGPEEAIRTTSHSAMSIATTDATRNGNVDFFVADMLGRDYERRQQQAGVRTAVERVVGASTRRMQEMQNTFQYSRGDGTFAETGALAGVEASGWTWASTFLDVNLNGYEDLLAANGHAYDAMSADAQIRIANSGAGHGPNWRRSLLMYPDLDLKNVAFRNRGDGTFEEVDDGWGLGEEADVSHGLATADLNQDGALDVVINRLNETVGIYRNQASAPRVAVRLAGRSPNTEAVGAKVRVTPKTGSVPAQEESVIAGGEYLSDSGETLSFAVGGADSVQIEVQWPAGDETVVQGRSGRLYEVRQPGATLDWEDSGDDTASPAGAFTSALFSFFDAGVGTAGSRYSDVESGSRSRDSTKATADTSRLFEDVSRNLGHSHTENRYPDFGRQPLLPRKLSQQGPGIAWADLSGNGRDDILIGTGRGGELAYYRNEGGGQFSRMQGDVLGQAFERDVTGMVTIPRQNGATVLVGHSNYERDPDDPETPSRILVFEADNGGLEKREELTFGDAAVGPLALADVNGDGRLDLFAGGRHLPGQYPVSVSSKLFINQGDTFRRDRSRSRVFEDLGLVTGAVFAEVNGDDAMDLFVATEWGPIHYFENRGNGHFVDRTEEIGLAEYTGFWRGIDVGDFNADGRVDVVAANWGWNSRYGQPPGAPRSPESPRLAHPIRIYYGDFTGNGAVEPIEAHYLPSREEFVPYWGFSEIGEAMPYVRRHIQSFEGYSKASLQDIIGEKRGERANTKEVSTLSHMVFLKRDAGGDPEYEGRALPWWSQLSAGFAPSVADVNGDGAHDIILSQNFFATEVKTPRQDGGRALWLKGEGTGQFTPVKGHQSGLLVYGEQRAAALGDMTQDGRVDVVVAQNGTETKLFRNVGATPGIRVHLEGRQDNLRGVGGTVRVEYEDGTMGPNTVIRAGSSYWSQHAFTSVLGTGDRTATTVHVRWPDGSRSERSVSPGRRSITVSHPDRR